MILAYNMALEERLTDWADAHQREQLGRDIRAAVYEIGRLKRQMQDTVDTDDTDPRAPARNLTPSQAIKLKSAFKQHYETVARDGLSLKMAMRRLDDRRAALAIGIRLMDLHLEMVTPGGVGRDSGAWVVAQHRIRVLEDLLAEIESIRAAAVGTDEAPYDNLQGTQ